jgi:hypothetical protein
MSSEDFVRGFLGLFPDENFSEVRKNIEEFHVMAMRSFVDICVISDY